MIIVVLYRDEAVYLSLCAHLPNKLLFKFYFKMWDDYAQLCGRTYEYDIENIYHSIEYLQNDLLQLGQWDKANMQLLRMESVVAHNLGKHELSKDRLSMGAWQENTWNNININLRLLWWYYRMYARQLHETSTFASSYARHHMPQPFGCKITYTIGRNNTFVEPNTQPIKCNPQISNIGRAFLNKQSEEKRKFTMNDLPRSVITKYVSDGSMAYASLAEVAGLFVTGLSGARHYHKKDGFGKGLLQGSIEAVEALHKNMLGRKDSQNYMKYAIDMIKHMLLGLQALASAAFPQSVDCYAQGNCGRDRLAENMHLILGHFTKAATIQEMDMKETSQTPTILLIPSFELYGHVLLFVGDIREAKDMFEKSLKRRVGRVLSIIGLARAHALLGNSEQATFFYHYLADQLSDAKLGNPFLEEANVWLKYYPTTGNRTLTRGYWTWPYL